MRSFFALSGKRALLIEAMSSRLRLLDPDGLFGRRFTTQEPAPSDGLVESLQLGEDGLLPEEEEEFRGWPLEETESSGGVTPSLPSLEDLVFLPDPLSS